MAEFFRGPEGRVDGHRLKSGFANWVQVSRWSLNAFQFFGGKRKKDGMSGMQYYKILSTACGIHTDFGKSVSRPGFSSVLGWVTGRASGL